MVWTGRSVVEGMKIIGRLEDNGHGDPLFKKNRDPRLRDMEIRYWDVKMIR